MLLLFIDKKQDCVFVLVGWNGPPNPPTHLWVVLLGIVTFRTEKLPLTVSLVLKYVLEISFLPCHVLILSHCFQKKRCRNVQRR